MLLRDICPDEYQMEGESYQIEWVSNTYGRKLIWYKMISLSYVTCARPFFFLSFQLYLNFFLVFLMETKINTDSHFSAYNYYWYALLPGRSKILHSCNNTEIELSPTTLSYRIWTTDGKRFQVFLFTLREKLRHSKRPIMKLFGFNQGSNTHSNLL